MSLIGSAQFKAYLSIRIKKHRTMTENKKHTAQKQEIKTNIVGQRRKNHKIKRSKI